MGINNSETKKWDWELDDKTENIYKNLCFQIEKVFQHKRECSFKTRERYCDGVKHFGKYIAEAYKKQNLNTIKPMHLHGYVEAMRESRYSSSYITTNLSAVRYFYDAVGKDSRKLPNNRQLEVDPRGHNERIGPDRSWSDLEVSAFVRYARDVGQGRYGDMVSLASLLGLRVHEVCRLDKTHLVHALNKGVLAIKGKGGLVRDVPINDLSLIRQLYDKTPKNAKVFVHNNEQTHKLIKNLQVFLHKNQDKFALGDKQLTMHGLRHLYAQKRYQFFLAKGFSEREAKKRVSHELGHHRIEITDIYLTEVH
jgi:site-specific recombinase XerD